MAHDASARRWFWSDMPNSAGHNGEASDPSAPRSSTITEMSSPPPRALDIHMQAYFVRVQSTTRLTCHPLEMCGEARVISEALLDSSADENKENLDFASWAHRLLHAGTERLSYSRTIAVVVREAIADLYWGDAQTGSELHLAFLKALTTAFFCSFFKTDLSFLDGVTGLDPISPVLEPTRAQVLNIAAFVGDLYALGVLADTVMIELVSTLVYGLQSLTHCRALHLLLLRACTAATRGLPLSMLHHWRDVLVCTALGWGIFTLPDTVKRWIIEICNVLDWMGCNERKASGARSMCHRWDKNLSGELMRQLLEYAPCATTGPQPQRCAPRRAPMQDISHCFETSSDVGGDVYSHFKSVA
ncbi:uncharacterized protein B0H18DRAFT_952450 [Fomitopsis serialis]|uniref:uncharacterized protein n=1 Tax=Fomitopsis serialis TaxID=139415 RepID=UPI002007E9C5|nr:uncharacterized protein B0H18DRAFT_952450 [Neoantrodia serialis]KAH9932347.1 hypothetical protein B0H18DRAFT_952450 [Neoantrodia serialis]